MHVHLPMQAYSLQLLTLAYVAHLEGGVKQF